MHYSAWGPRREVTRIQNLKLGKLGVHPELTTD